MLLSDHFVKWGWLLPIGHCVEIVSSDTRQLITCSLVIYWSWIFPGFVILLDHIYTWSFQVFLIWIGSDVWYEHHPKQQPFCAVPYCQVFKAIDMIWSQMIQSFWVSHSGEWINICHFACSHSFHSVQSAITLLGPLIDWYGKTVLKKQLPWIIVWISESYCHDRHLFLCHSENQWIFWLQQRFTALLFTVFKSVIFWSTPRVPPLLFGESLS